MFASSLVQAKTFLDGLEFNCLSFTHTIFLCGGCTNGALRCNIDNFLSWSLLRKALIQWQQP
jgi:hypothetical protein